MCWSLFFFYYFSLTGAWPAVSLHGNLYTLYVKVQGLAVVHGKRIIMHSPTPRKTWCSDFAGRLIYCHGSSSAHARNKELLWL